MSTTDTVAPAEQCSPHSSTLQPTRGTKSQDIEMDRELEQVMALARCELVHKKGRAQDVHVALAECRAQFDAILEKFPAATVSADYYVTRARFEEFAGNHEAVADLYAAAATNSARPREVVQNNFIQFMARQSAGILNSKHKRAPSAPKSKHAIEPLHPSAVRPKWVRTVNQTHPKSAHSPARTAQARNGRQTYTPTEIVRTPTLGAPQRVRTPMQHVTSVLDFGSEEPDTDGDNQNHIEESLPGTFQDCEARKNQPRPKSAHSPARTAQASSGRQTYTPTEIVRTPTLGAPQRVRTPMQHVTSVLDFGSEEPDTDGDNQNHIEESLPGTLQDYAAKLWHRKSSKRDTDEKAKESLTSAVVFSPVRVPKSQVEATGSSTALTPVRRSPRLNRHADLTKQCLNDMLEQTKYCYKPNTSVNVLR